MSGDWTEGFLRVTKTGISVEKRGGQYITCSGSHLSDGPTVETVMRMAEHLCRMLRLPYADPAEEALRQARQRQTEVIARETVRRASLEIVDENRWPDGSEWGQ